MINLKLNRHWVSFLKIELQITLKQNKKIQDLAELLINNLRIT